MILYVLVIYIARTSCKIAISDQLNMTDNKENLLQPKGL